MQAHAAHSIAESPAVPDRSRRRLNWRHWAVALGSVSAAFAIRWFLTPYLGNELPFLAFIAASLIAASYGGAVTGIMALLVGLLLGDIFFIGPGRAFGFVDHIDLARVLRYLATASLGIFLIEVLRRSKVRTQAALEEVKQEVQRRKQSEQKLALAQNQLAGYAEHLEQRVVDRTAELRDMVQSLESVLYHVAHDLRAPLRALSSFTTLLGQDYATKLDARALDYCRRINEASLRMDALTEGLLNYGHLAHSEIALSAISLKAPVDEALRRLQHEIANTGAEIRVPPALPRARANQELLATLLVEVFTNALKFARPGVCPKITVSAEEIGTSVRLWIEDNGVGIDPKYQDRIFQIFERLGPSNEPRVTGIGLALVAKGTQRMGGCVGVQSSPGQGSRFWLQFPA